ncbi:MAG: phenylacetate--CoA ligase family protein [Flavobacteriaceae bacterium]|nr:phenylacetate--CoA ligase family protein [Flavobacteriaceae bacterium]
MKNRLVIFLHSIVLNLYACLIFIRRYNILFFYFLKKINQSKRDLDLNSLRLFLRHANTNSKFWKHRFEKYSFNVESGDLISELKKLPVLTKKEVSENKEDIRCYKLLSTKVKTSGTTGSSLIFSQTILMENFQWAIWWRYRNDIGISLFQKCGWFGGRKIISPSNNKIGFWRTILPLNQVMFSAYHLNDETVSRYIQKIESAKIQWLHGYPSQISYLAELIHRNNLKPPQGIKIITTGAEKLYESQRTFLSNFFKCEVYQHYGLAEGVSNISEDKNKSLSPDQDFAFTEFMPTSDKSIYKIVGTNYRNKAFPLIRYQSGDEVLFNEKGGIKEIIGRDEDYVFMLDGTKLGRLDHIFKSFEEVAESQIYQSKDFSVEVRIVPRDTFNFNTEKKLHKEISSYFSNNLEFKIKKVTQIEKTKSNKFKFVISEIK